MDKKLRAYYVRQLRRSGWRGNHGGWVFGPVNLPGRSQGWNPLIRHLAAQIDKLGRVLGKEAK